MVDFSRPLFDKQISLFVRKGMSATGKWPNEKLGNIAEVIAGQSPESSYYNNKNEGIAFSQGKKDFGDYFLEPPTSWTTRTTKISVRGDILMSVRAPVGDVNMNPLSEVCIGRGLAAIRVKSHVVPDYLYEFISQNKSLFKGNQGAAFESIATADLQERRIPVPPIEIQKKIIFECNAINDQVKKSKSAIAEADMNILARIGAAYTNGSPVRQLSEICEIKRGRFTHRPRNDPKFFNGPYPFIQTGDVVRAKGFKVPYTQTLNEAGLAVIAIANQNAAKRLGFESS